MQTLISTADSRGILTLSMNRPHVSNAFDPDLIRDLTKALEEADKNHDVRLVVLTGEGRYFSAGADLHWMKSLINASQQDNENDALMLARLMRNLNYLSKPTIARINGAAFGGGLGLIAACDITIADDNARFGLTESRLGLAPAVISPYVYRRVGEANARRYFLSGERFGCRQAMAVGLIQQCVATRELDSAVENVIIELLKGGPLAVACCKQLVFTVAGHDRESQRRMDTHTAELIARLRVSPEGQEGLTAFLEKRRPGWVRD